MLLDGLARARRRRQPLGRWSAWALACGLPFLVCALFARLLGGVGAIAATPSRRCLRGALPFDGAAASAVLSCALVLGLAWLAWPVLVRRLGLAVRPTPGRPAGPMSPGSRRCSCCCSSPVLHGFSTRTRPCWLCRGCTCCSGSPLPERRPRPIAGLGLLALALLPLGLLIAFYAHQLGYGPGGVAWTAVLLLAGGHVGVGAAVLWSCAFGCVVALALVALTPAADPVAFGPDERPQVTIRGPLSYAGPGSLGGTESALRR